jgi:hypothetical protein
VRHLVAISGLVVSGGGCSLLYNPSNIGTGQQDAAGPDVEIIADADPSMMVVDSVFPATLYEGVGTLGGRASLLVLHGHHFVKDASGALTVTFAPANVATITDVQVARDGDYIALAVTVPNDMIDNDATAPIGIAITVTENVPGGAPISSTLDASHLSVTHLDNLMVAPTTSAGLKSRYAMIDLPGFTINASSTVTPPLILHSMSSITIRGTLSANANGMNAMIVNAGPGGCLGGGNGASGACLGGGGGSSGLGGGGGGGAGFAASGGSGTNGGSGGAMVGDTHVSSYVTNTPSGGGGGNDQPGGGGGSIVELTAAGDVTVGAINAMGAHGGNANTLSGGGGGGGAGGVIVVRAGGTLTGPSAFTATGGAAGTGGGTLGGPGGAGSAGRTRWDAATVLNAPTGTNLYIGPMPKSVPVSVIEQTPTLDVRGKSSDSAEVRVFDKDGLLVGQLLTVGFGGGTPATGVVMPMLKAGYNRVCFTVANPTDASLDEATNCTEIAFLPGGP